MNTPESSPTFTGTLTQPPCPRCGVVEADVRKLCAEATRLHGEREALAARVKELEALELMIDRVKHLERDLTTVIKERNEWRKVASGLAMAVRTLSSSPYHDSVTGLTPRQAFAAYQKLKDAK